MMKKILNKNFFNRSTLTVAKELLGKYIVREIGKRQLVGRVVEAEAYDGPLDLASHASRGQTTRNAVMFGPAGVSYIYLIYGLNYCFNIVTENQGYPAAVLIRAVEPVEGTGVIMKNRGFKTPLPPLLRGAKKLLQAPFNKGGIGGFLKEVEDENNLYIFNLVKDNKKKELRNLTNGPGKFCQAFKIDKNLNLADITKGKKLWFEDRGEKIKKTAIIAAKRVGVDYAGAYKDKHWRFFIKDNKWVSKK